MKTPALITRILGLFLATLGGVSALAESAALSQTNVPSKTSIQITVPSDLPGKNAPVFVTPTLSPWTKEIVKLAQSGIEESIMLAFIDNSGAFSLGADQIVYLNDIGVPATVVNAMLQHDREIISGERIFTITSEPPYEPLFPRKTGDQAASESAKPVPVTSPLTSTPPAPDNTATTPLALAHNDAEISSLFASNQRMTETEKTRPLYPVRDPQAVELVPPIILIDAPAIEPNTIIVYGFPKSAQATPAELTPTISRQVR